MLAEDVSFLRCPRTREPLRLDRVALESAGGEVLEAVLTSESGQDYPVRNGIPRFVDDAGDNRTWDYKWTAIDRGRGLNYRILDRSDPAYATHDIFDRNDHGGRAYEHARDRLALDVGCGVGQYSVKLLQEHAPRRMVALDLTRGVDVFRAIVEERYPELLPRLLIVQGSALALPFADDAFDFVMSLGVLMHTGHTRDALTECTRVLSPGGHLNVWIYSSDPVPIEAEEAGRLGLSAPLSYLPLAVRFQVVRLWLRLFRRLPHPLTVRIVKLFSSSTWHRATTTRGVARLATLIFPAVDHFDPDYRFINNYDGYVNAWTDTWNEHEILPVLQAHDCVPLGLSDWRLGIWAVKLPGFYETYRSSDTSSSASPYVSS